MFFKIIFPWSNFDLQLNVVKPNSFSRVLYSRVKGELMQCHWDDFQSNTNRAEKNSEGKEKERQIQKANREHEGRKMKVIFSLDRCILLLKFPFLGRIHDLKKVNLKWQQLYGNLTIPFFFHTISSYSNLPSLSLSLTIVVVKSSGRCLVTAPRAHYCYKSYILFLQQDKNGEFYKKD